MPGRLMRLLALTLPALLSGVAAASAQSLQFEVLHAFDLASGAIPWAGLTRGGDGRLYGTTSAGGAYGHGTIFRYDPSTETFAKVHDFDGTGGKEPVAELLLAADGALYGTTYYGGAMMSGTLFRYDTGSGTFTSLFSFPYDELPGGKLVEAGDGSLYGTTGRYGDWYSLSIHRAIYRFDRASATMTVVHRFFNSPLGDRATTLVKGTDGAYYATTTNRVGWGTLIRCDLTLFPAAVNEIVEPLVEDPIAAPLLASDGAFYGTTAGDGPIPGTLYRFTPATGALVTRHVFGAARGRVPAGALIEADGAFYGTTLLGGMADSGTVFRFDPVTSKHTMMHSFAGSDGARPLAGLLHADDGALYGTTMAGGSFGQGVLFRLRPFAPADADQPRVSTSRASVARSTRGHTISWPIPGRSGTAIVPSADTVTGGSTRSSAK